MPSAARGGDLFITNFLDAPATAYLLLRQVRGCRVSYAPGACVCQTLSETIGCLEKQIYDIDLCISIFLLTTPARCLVPLFEAVRCAPFVLSNVNRQR